jgi:virulence-associated protein VagC
MFFPAHSVPPFSWKHTLTYCLIFGVHYKTKFDLLSNPIDLTNSGGLNAYIYYGYIIGSTIQYNAYSITVGSFCDSVMGPHCGVITGQSECDSTIQSGENQDNFREAIDILKANYVYTQAENIGWEEVYFDNVSLFNDCISLATFEQQLFDLLNPLENEHFYVSGVIENTTSHLLPNYGDSSTRIKYFKNTTQSIGDGVISYALTNDDIVYVKINSFPRAEDFGISQLMVNDIFDKYPSAIGMIIDIRRNGGGVNDIADMFAINLINQDLTYAYYDRNYDGGVDAIKVEDDGVRFYQKPVVGLIGPRTFSQAELFTRFLRLAGVTLVGVQEYGVEGRGKTFSLSNGVSFSIPVQFMFDENMVEIKRKGIIPDIVIPVENSYDLVSDFVLERAIEQVLYEVVN